MKNFKWWPAIGLVTASVALTGCGGNGNSSSSNASLRIVNATLSHSSLDLLVNAAAAAPAATVTDTASAYVTPASGSVTLQINDNGGATALATIVPTLTGGNHYALIAYESGGAIKSAILNEDFAAPAAGAATLRLVDLAAEAGPLDLYVTTNACTVLAGVSPSYSFVSPTTTTSVSLTQTPGTYNVCATAHSAPTDLRMSQSVTVAALQVATVVMTPTVGGQLVNGALLVQQGTYTAARNPNARVRLAAAVAGGATVAASAAGAVFDTLASPNLGFGYKLVPAGSALTVSVNGGAAVSAPAAPAVGADVTLLVYGNPAGPTLSLIADDNRLPTDGTTKLRFINGVNGNPGTLTLTANTKLVGNGIAVNTASGYASIPGSTAVTILKLSSSTNSAPITDNTNVLDPNTVYTVLAGGDSATPPVTLQVR